MARNIANETAKVAENERCKHAVDLASSFVMRVRAAGSRLPRSSLSRSWPAPQCRLRRRCAIGSAEH